MGFGSATFGTQQRGAGLGHGIHVDRGTYRIGEYINEDQLRRLLSHLFANCDEYDDEDERRLVSS